MGVRQVTGEFLRIFQKSGFPTVQEVQVLGWVSVPLALIFLVQNLPVFNLFTLQRWS